LKLCHNQNPTPATCCATDENTRWDSTKWQRLPIAGFFYDFTFSPPKSVSIQALIANDSGCWMHTAVPCGLPSRIAALRRDTGASGNGTNRSGLPETSSAPRSAMTPPARLIPLAHALRHVQRQRLIQPKIVGKALSNYEMLSGAEVCRKCLLPRIRRDLRQFGYEIENKPRGDF